MRLPCGNSRKHMLGESGTATDTAGHRRHRRDPIGARAHNLCNGTGDAAKRELPRAMTTNEMVGGDLLLHRHFLAAYRLRVRTPGVKVAAWWRVGRGGDLALEDDPV